MKLQSFIFTPSLLEFHSIRFHSPNPTQPTHTPTKVVGAEMEKENISYSFGEIHKRHPISVVLLLS